MKKQETIGDRVLTARSAVGWSQARLAQAVGLSQQMLSKLELGSSAKTALLYEIATALGVRYRYLKFGELPMVADNPLADATPEQFLEAFFSFPPDQRADMFGEMARRGFAHDDHEDEAK